MQEIFEDNDSMCNLVNASDQSELKDTLLTLKFLCENHMIQDEYQEFEVPLNLVFTGHLLEKEVEFIKATKAVIDQDVKTPVLQKCA